MLRRARAVLGADSISLPRLLSIAVGVEVQPDGNNLVCHFAAKSKSNKAGAKADAEKKDGGHVHKNKFADYAAKLRQQDAPSLSLLTEEQLKLAKSLVPTADNDGADSSADLQSLKQLGLPINQSDIASLLHQSLSNLAGQNVHFRPYVFSNIFQSAPVVANYVAAALEGNNNWNRVERFFLSSVEADPNIKGIKVMISGRLGQKASMASIKEWKYGEHSLANVNDFVDYGTAGALTRMGMIGVKVWIRFHRHAVLDKFHQKQTGFMMPLSKVLSQPRVQLPNRSSSAWWNLPGTLQPVDNHTWKAFVPGFDPQSSALDMYLMAQKKYAFKSMEERNTFIAGGVILDGADPEDSGSSSSSSSSSGSSSDER